MRLLAFISAAVLLAAAPAALAKTVIYTGAHGGDFLSKPEKLKYSAKETGTTQSVTLKNLSWKQWGDSKATSPTTAKLCSDQAGCFTTSDASVKAKKLVSLDSIGYYTKLVVSFGQNQIKFSLPTP
jgi:hypothetical protein